MVRIVSPTNQIPVMYIPLSLILIINAARDLYEDYKKHRSDEEENSRESQVWERSSQNFQSKLRKELFVGEVIKLKKGEEIPADCVLLRGEGKKAEIFIETKNLDGEVNLKRKIFPREIQKFSKENFNEFLLKKYEICFEPPNLSLNEFYGFLRLENQNLTLSYPNFVQRGAKIVQGEEIYAVVVYTGYFSI